MAAPWSPADATAYSASVTVQKRSRCSTISCSSRRFSVGPSKIHDRYTEEVENPRTKRTIRAYLSKMEQYNLLEAEGTSRDREYSLVDSAAASPTQ
jgi:hypothetical protein